MPEIIPVISDLQVVADRVIDTLDASGPCWTWKNKPDAKGYGQVNIRRAGRAQKTARAHRIVWQIMVGECPAGLEPDHLCRNKLCCNPDHLEWVTHAENVRRGAAGRHKGNVREVCKSGRHNMATNSQVRRAGTRYCKACQNEKQRALYAARKESTP